jgi:Fe-S cluster biogenesis protein NfuA
LWLRQILYMQKQDILSKIDTVLNEIRPHLFVDGGNIEVVDITDDMCVKLKWLGNCQGCSMSEMTMKAGIEQTLKAKMPEIVSVEAVN